MLANRRVRVGARSLGSILCRATQRGSCRGGAANPGLALAAHLDHPAGAREHGDAAVLQLRRAVPAPRARQVRLDGAPLLRRASAAGSRAAHRDAVRSCSSIDRPSTPRFVQSAPLERARSAEARQGRSFERTVARRAPDGRGGSRMRAPVEERVRDVLREVRRVERAERRERARQLVNERHLRRRRAHARRRLRQRRRRHEGHGRREERERDDKAVHLLAARAARTPCGPTGGKREKRGLRKFFSGGESSDRFPHVGEAAPRSPRQLSALGRAHHNRSATLQDLVVESSSEMIC